MNKRIFFTVAVSLSFFTLLVTGVMMYVAEYSYFTAGLHLWSAVIVLVMISGHLYNNWMPYKNHLKKQFGKKVFIATAALIGLVSWGVDSEVSPFVTLIALGEHIRGASKVTDGDYTVIDFLPAEQTDNKLSLFIKAGREYESQPQPLYWGLTYTSTPQMAVWLEDAEGHYVKTLYVTGKVATSTFYSAKQGEGRVRRPETLPYWSHKRGVKAQDGLYVPKEDSIEFDGRTAATPKSDHLLLLDNPQSQAYRVLVEINRSYDFNAYYHKNKYPDDPIYSGSGSSGQPSLIYEGHVTPGHTDSVMLNIIGHGHHSGQNGQLYTDTSHITTAKDIVEFMVLRAGSN